MRVLGIDPGTWRMGYGAVEERNGEQSAIECGVLSPRGSPPIEQRLVYLHESLLTLIDRLKPDTVAVEEPFVSLAIGGNMKTAVAIGQAQAVALMAATERKLPIARYTPTQVKQTITGYGAGAKEQVAVMVQMLLRMPSLPSPLDATDALAIALCHLRERDVNSMVIDTPAPKRRKAAR